MVHPTIVNLRKKAVDLENANKTLLQNNVVMAESNKELRERIINLESSVKEDAAVMSALCTAKEQCKQTYERIVSEKTAALQEKERYIASLHNTVWNLRNSYLCREYRFEETKGGFNLVFGFQSK